MGVLNIPAFLAKRVSFKKRTRDLHEPDVLAFSASQRQVGRCYSLAQGIRRIVAHQRPDPVGAERE
jgi:hypothetical protein